MLFSNTLLLIVSFLFFSLADSRIDLPVVRLPTRSNSLRSTLHPSSDAGYAYYLQVNLGTPSQPVFLQLDTGSSALVVDSAAYWPPNSSTSQNDYCDITRCSTSCPICTGSSGGCQDWTNVGTQMCNFELSYGGGSIDVFGMADTITVPGTNWNQRVFFGVSVTEPSPLWSSPLQGIWGLAYEEENLWITQPTVLQQIITKYDLYNGFSLCLTPTGNSAFTVGYSWSTQLSQFSFTTVVDTIGGYNLYNVQVTDFSVGGKSLSSGSEFNVVGSPTIVDSGTSLLLIPNSVYQSLVAIPSIAALVNYTKYCSSYDQSTLPTITITLAGTSPLKIPPSAYVATAGTGACFKIQSIGSNSFGPILGDVFMQNYNIFFDLQNNRVGFADPSTCTSDGFQNVVNVPFILLALYWILLI